MVWPEMVMLTRFAQTPFQLLETPKRLQEILESVYRTMLFDPVRESVEHDQSYRAVPSMAFIPSDPEPMIFTTHRFQMR